MKPRKLWLLGLLAFGSFMVWWVLIMTGHMPDWALFPTLVVIMVFFVVFFWSLRISIWTSGWKKVGNTEETQRTLDKWETKFQQSPNMLQEYTTMAGFSFLISLFVWFKWGFTLWWSIALTTSIMLATGAFSVWYFPVTIESRKKDMQKQTKMQKGFFAAFGLCIGVIYGADKMLHTPILLQAVCLMVAALFAGYVAVDYWVWVKKK
jgi:hypothetical protein